MTELFNGARKRLGIKGGASIEEPTRNYYNFDPDDYDNLTFIYKSKVINFRNINEGLIPSSQLRESGVNRLKLMGILTEVDIRMPKRRLEN